MMVHLVSLSLSLASFLSFCYFLIIHNYLVITKSKSALVRIVVSSQLIDERYYFVSVGVNLFSFFNEELLAGSLGHTHLIEQLTLRIGCLSKYFLDDLLHLIVKRNQCADLLLNVSCYDQVLVVGAELALFIFRYQIGVFCNQVSHFSVTCLS